MAQQLSSWVAASGGAEKFGTLRVILFYKFVDLNPKVFAPLLERCALERGLSGRLLVAPDGINGTLAGLEAQVRGFEAACISDRVIMDVKAACKRDHCVSFRRVFLIAFVGSSHVDG